MANEIHLNHCRKVLKIKSDESIANGSHFPGFFGIAPEDFSKEELIMICNVLHYAVVKAATDIVQFKKM